MNAVNRHGNTALHFCHEFGHDKFADYLKRKGANTTLQNSRRLKVHFRLFSCQHSDNFLSHDCTLFCSDQWDCRPDTEGASDFPDPVPQAVPTPVSPTTSEDLSNVDDLVSQYVSSSISQGHHDMFMSCGRMGSMGSNPLTFTASEPEINSP